MKLKDFVHIPYKVEVNKKQIPIVEIPYSEYEVWNKFYLWCRKSLMQVDPTDSLAMPNGRYKGMYRFMVTHINQSHELVIVCKSSCYRFIIQPSKLKGNKISGRKSVIELYNMMDKHHIDLNKYACSNGLQIKQEIESPLIEAKHKTSFGLIFEHVYHLDFNSSYASRIVEAIPELREAYEELYAHRKEDNDKFKHVLTNSIGCFQSRYCPDYNDRRRAKPFQFANLSKIAINGTRQKVFDMVTKLEKKGMIVLLTNTDGIWYQSHKGPYHDQDEGTNLCQWKTDHSDCKFLMSSVGAYQYEENGKCTTVLRGNSNLDKIKRREDWVFGDIERINGRQYYYFDESRGIVEDYA